MKPELLTRTAEILEELKIFEVIYEHYAPPVNDLVNYPVAAIVDEGEKRVRLTTSANSFDVKGFLVIYIYAAQRDGEYNDILHPIVSAVIAAVEKDAMLQSMITDGYISQVTKDAGSEYPAALAQLEFFINYREKC